MMDQHADILIQLAELKKWHGENCGNVESGASSPADCEDQEKLYRLLGLSPSFIHEIETSQSTAGGLEIQSDEVTLNNTSARDDNNASGHDDPVNRLKITNDLSGVGVPLAPLPENAIAKRPFLKKGEGLATRFKVHPDQYKLHNLPKYKYSGSNKRHSKGKKDGQLSEVQLRYCKEKTRKSCLKNDTSLTGLNVEQLRAQMKEICIAAMNDESGERETLVLPGDDEKDEKAKRMLDFSRRSPRVTFDNEVIRIPFENYFHPDVIDDEFSDCTDVPSDNSGDGEGEKVDATAGDFHLGTDFATRATSSTPVELCKQIHLGDPAAKSPRTVLVEKGSLMREKIRELEEETKAFREQNRQVQKMKQAIELEKVELHNERHEMERKLKEQKLQVELYFEGLREQLEQERTRMDQRSTVPSQKTKEQMKDLHDRIEELEKELKSRELKHSASQARLRCHIRTLEKENKEQAATIECLKKDNKRLELETSRLLRQKNNKMLLEINKNIAKLASTSSEAQKIAAEPLKSAPPPSKPVAHKTRPQVVAKQLTVTSKVDHGIGQSLSSSDAEDDHSTSDERELPARNKESSNYFPLAARNENRTNECTKEVNGLVQMNETVGPRKEIVNDDGSKDIYYPNGNLKKVSPNGMIIKIMYFNKDIKETNIDEGTVKYYYAETKTWHTSYLDGLEILEFPSGQTEHRFKNGKIEIYFPNGLVRITNPKDNDVLEEWRYPDGTIVVETKNKEKMIKLPNGQKEIHTADHKRREYPDGTVKLVYCDGRTETRYANGRIRIKDKNGQLVSDSQNIT